MFSIKSLRGFLYRAVMRLGNAGIDNTELGENYYER